MNTRKEMKETVHEESEGEKETRVVLDGRKE